jgi:hypothetical protein
MTGVSNPLTATENTLHKTACPSLAFNAGDDAAHNVAGRVTRDSVSKSSVQNNECERKMRGIELTVRVERCTSTT